MTSIAQLQEEKSQFKEQLDIILDELKNDPSNAEFLELKQELESGIALVDESIADLQPKQASKPVKEDSPPPKPEKWSREDHPAFKNEAPVEDKKPAPANFQVNDTVLAKWVTGDKSFYAARITSITGSASAPFYIVKFKGYDNTETLRSGDIRVMSNKRKADGFSTQPPPPTGGPGFVSSAGATTYPDAKKPAIGADDMAPPKPKKIKAKKELEAGKSKWQEFNATSKYAKTNKKKKESMFRTPENVNGKVGFIGSGQTMRKDATRSRHVHQMQEDHD